MCRPKRATSIEPRLAAETPSARGDYFSWRVGQHVSEDRSSHGSSSNRASIAEKVTRSALRFEAGVVIGAHKAVSWRNLAGHLRSEGRQNAKDASFN
jgi:hypothetical protein